MTRARFIGALVKQFVHFKQFIARKRLENRDVLEHLDFLRAIIVGTKESHAGLHHYYP